MEEMIARWLRETRQKREQAKQNLNIYQMFQMDRLAEALIEMRDKLLKPHS